MTGVVYAAAGALLSLGLIPPMIVDGKAGMTHPVEFGLYAMGAVSTAAAFLLLVWRVARPHVEDYVERRIQAVTYSVHQALQPMAGNVQRVRDEVPSAAREIQAVRVELFALTRLLGQVDDTLNDHVVESRAYLDKATKALAEQGIQLPPGGPDHQ